MSDSDITGYRYTETGVNQSHGYLLPAISCVLEKLTVPARARRLFELGCGNGNVTYEMTRRGWDLTGVDPSAEGIEQARAAHPELKLACGSAYDDLTTLYGQFPVVLSLEVVEHVYAPRRYVRTLFDLLTTGGMPTISTPFHGYWKKLALALTGRMDDHFTALWDHGHIKFWSKRTLSMLVKETGFVHVRFELTGRISPLARSMFAIARKP